MKTFTFVALIIYCVSCWSVSASDAVDIIRLASAKSKDDHRFDFPNHVLTLALEASEQKYGAFEIIFSPLNGARDRMLKELKSGKLINVHSAPSRPEWEESAIPVMFPVLKGLLGYRLLLVNRSNAETFSKITTLDELKKLRAGLGTQWSTTKVLVNAGGYNLVTSNDYENLFTMLSYNRFDYFIRGVNEIFQEHTERGGKYPNLMIEPTIALELPLPWFFFVSPEYPKLAERIDFGLHVLKDNGTFDKVFFDYHQDALQQANLSSRKIFKIENSQLSQHPIYQDTSYWINPLKDKVTLGRVENSSPESDVESSH